MQSEFVECCREVIIELGIEPRHRLDGLLPVQVLPAGKLTSFVARHVPVLSVGTAVFGGDTIKPGPIQDATPRRVAISAAANSRDHERTLRFSLAPNHKDDGIGGSAKTYRPWQRLIPRHSIQTHTVPTHAHLQKFSSWVSFSFQIA